MLPLTRKKNAEQKCSAVGCCEELKLTARNDGEHPLCEAHKRAPVARCTDGAEVCFCFYCNKAHGVEEFTYKTNICDRQYLRRREKALHQSATAANPVVSANVEAASNPQRTCEGETPKSTAPNSSPLKRGRKPKKEKTEVAPKSPGKQRKRKVINDNNNNNAHIFAGGKHMNAQVQGGKKLNVHAVEAAAAVSGLATQMQMVGHKMDFASKFQAVQNFRQSDDLVSDGSDQSIGPRIAAPRITLGMRVQTSSTCRTPRSPD